MSRWNKNLQHKYDNTLDSMWALFNHGRDREKTLEAKLNQIKVVCGRSTDAEDKIDDVLQILNDNRNEDGE